MVKVDAIEADAPKNIKGTKRAEAEGKLEDRNLLIITYVLLCKMFDKNL